MSGFGEGARSIRGYGAPTQAVGSIVDTMRAKVRTFNRGYDAREDARSEFSIVDIRGVVIPRRGMWEMHAGRSSVVGENITLSLPVLSTDDLKEGYT